MNPEPRASLRWRFENVNFRPFFIGEATLIPLGSLITIRAYAKSIANSTEYNLRSLLLG